MGPVRMVRGERHQAMVGHCAHQMGPSTVSLDGPERATALGYSRVYLHTPAGTHVSGMAASTIHVQRRVRSTTKRP